MNMNTNNNHNNNKVIFLGFNSNTVGFNSNTVGFNSNPVGFNSNTVGFMVHENKRHFSMTGKKRKDIDLSNVDTLIKIVDHEINSFKINKEWYDENRYYIEDMMKFYEIEYHTNCKQEKHVYLDPYSYKKLSFKEFHDKVLKNNASVIMPKLEEYKLEKEAYLEWIDYNTPSLKNLMVTPLLGTSLGNIDKIDNNYDDYISNWNIAFFYLTWEYSILKKAKSSLDNTNLEGEYKKAYDYWVNRQFMMLQPIDEKFAKGHLYITDFHGDLDYMYREISQDSLYVMLNILLCKSIVENSNLNTNNKVNLDVLQKIMSDHYNTYDKGYKCMFELRRYKNNFENSVYFLEQIYKQSNKDKSSILWTNNNNNWYDKYLGK